MPGSGKQFLGKPVVLAEFEKDGDLRLLTVRVVKAEVREFLEWLLDSVPEESRPLGLPDIDGGGTGEANAGPKAA